MESGKNQQKEAVKVPSGVTQSPRGSGGKDRKAEGVIPNEGINEPTMFDFCGSSGRASHTKSNSDQRVTKGCSNSQKIDEIQGVEVVGD